MESFFLSLHIVCACPLFLLPHLEIRHLLNYCTDGSLLIHQKTVLCILKHPDLTVTVLGFVHTGLILPCAAAALQDTDKVML